ncbi:nucleoside triphosphate pyrophosphohydrolase [Prevotella cerevisiae]|uniref:Nucleoside triphosphate pyrophosphohydrolase n=1 Tax=Segatella cerevisiae TaxID=2053716 RepID=A0ABT1BVN8_9BACT|nr:nucleoside triphosphate pyrophosphohydrolase [Segatella cerevisiae]MCO6025024.1 nucleoside triphosphate pyrophosphohydrolase [Segatella cerevisiae]
MHSKEEKLEAFGRLMDVQHRLRKECPWDRKQTFESLRPNTIEEVFELCDALMKKDYRNIMKELGDVMEHVVFYCLMGNEDNEFDIADVCNQEADKLMFRHPFINWSNGAQTPAQGQPKWSVSNPDLKINAQGQVVYRDAPDQPSESGASSVQGDKKSGNLNDEVRNSKPSNASEVESSWEQIKQKERDGNQTVLGGVPEALPSLIKAYRIQDKARNVGFDWKEKGDVWAKVREEMDELEVELRKEDKDKSTRELGDVLFSVINAARLYHLNPDNALEHTNRKFIRRFNYVERKIKETGKSFKDVTLEDMDKLWNEAKKEEKG